MSNPWLPPVYSDFDAAAIQAVARGEADAAQQVHAIKFLVEVLCGTYDVSFRPESDRATAFAEGKRFVGLQIVKLIKLNISALKKPSAR